MTKIALEDHLRTIAAAISQKAGLLGNFCSHFFPFILPRFEYCMPVWLSAADSHLRLFDREISNPKFNLIYLSYSLVKRRKAGCLTLLFKILNNPDHPLYSKSIWSLSPKEDH